MKPSDKRKAPRVTCSIGIHLRGEWTLVKARVADIGRLGARVHVALEELGLPPDAPLVEVGKHIEELLAQDVVAQFRPDLVGSLVERHIHAVRIARDSVAAPSVHVGCVFDRPLTQADAVALGLPIPMEGETPEAALAAVEGKAPHARAPEHLPSDEADNAFADLRWALTVRKMGHRS